MPERMSNRLPCLWVLSVLLAFGLLPGLAAAKSPSTRPAPKLKPVAMTVEQSMAGFEARRRELIERTASVMIDRATGRTSTRPEHDPYGNGSICQLVLGQDIAAANTQLRRVARYMERAPGTQRDPRGESDFAAMSMARAWLLFKGTDTLEPATRQAIRTFFRVYNFESTALSENHALLFHTARYLMAGELPEEPFAGFGGRTGKALAAEDGDWLKTFIRFRARRGWAEFDSACYLPVDFQCLACLFDYAPDADLRRLAGTMMDLLLVDLAVDSLHGMCCGANGRIYGGQAVDHATAGTHAIEYLYFGNFDKTSLQPRRGMNVDALVSKYRPRRIVLQIALSRPDRYVSRERKHLHNMTDLLPAKPLGGSIRKLTLWSPQFVLGSVQYQDLYPPGRSAWYAHHEQHEWDLSFGTRTTARLFTHHPNTGPRPEHGYWTGDLGCGCVSTFQNRTAVLALFDIPAKQPCQFIHAYVPRRSFDEVVEEDGWIFVREGPAAAALRMLGGHVPTTQGDWVSVEVISPGAKNGSVCEVGRLADFGGFAGFRREIVANTIDFDREAMRLTYTSRRAGTIRMDAKQLREVDGRPADLDYATYDCPYIQSAWDSGVIELIHGSNRERLDFTGAADQSAPSTAPDTGSQ